MTECDADECRCSLEPFPLAITCEDNTTIMGFWCLCHALEVMAIVNDLTKEAIHDIVSVGSD